MKIVEKRIEVSFTVPLPVDLTYEQAQQRAKDYIEGFKTFWGRAENCKAVVGMYVLDEAGNRCRLIVS